MESKETLAEYTLEDVAQYNTVDNLWVVIHGKVYDVSGYLDDHPGGKDAMLEVAGTDATGDFEFVGHSEDAFKTLVKFETGSLAEYSVCEKRTMRKQILSDEFENEGLPFFKVAWHRTQLLETKLELWKRLGLATLGLTLIPVMYVKVLRHYIFQLGSVLDFGGFQSGVLATLILFGALAAAASAWFRRCVFHYKDVFEYPPYYSL
ncbi:Cytochrome b5 isoform A [Metarhizium brunneum]|uniref:Cytochrome b5 isoform A n=1 Tax=Metarhizium brunneum TaxID=500148 RepID=A0A7D5YZ28_9HYPO